MAIGRCGLADGAGVISSLAGPSGVAVSRRGSGLDDGNAPGNRSLSSGCANGDDGFGMLPGVL
jgi:hypothetical protein